MRYSPRPIAKEIGTAFVKIPPAAPSFLLTASPFRTIGKKGNALIVPEIVLEGWWNSLGDAACPDNRVIELYRDHATSEQFHSEFKADLYIERLPSGKFSTTDLVIAASVLSCNVLRYICLAGLLRDDSPVRQPAKRRRLRTVTQELLSQAARVVESGRCLGVEILPRLPGIFELRGGLRQARRRLKTPAARLPDVVLSGRKVRSLGEFP